MMSETPADERTVDCADNCGRRVCLLNGWKIEVGPANKALNVLICTSCHYKRARLLPS